MSIPCGDPQCDVCYTSAERAKYASLGSMPSWSSMGSVTINFDVAKDIADAVLSNYRISPQDLGLSMRNKEQSMSTTTQRVINDLRELDESELPRISAEVDNIKARKKTRIAEGLEGIVMLETLKDSGIRRFALVYYQNCEARTAKGVEFGDTELIGKDDVEKVHRVYVQGRDYPACGAHYTMPALRKKLEDNNIVFRIARYSEDEA